MILGGVALGLYVGVWVCLVGGIIAVIEQVRADEIEAAAVAWGVARILCASLFGYLSAIALVLPGVGIASSD